MLWYFKRKLKKFLACQKFNQNNLFSLFLVFMQQATLNKRKNQDSEHEETTHWQTNLEHVHQPYTCLGENVCDRPRRQPPLALTGTQLSNCTHWSLLKTMRNAGAARMQCAGALVEYTTDLLVDRYPEN